MTQVQFLAAARRDLAAIYLYPEYKFGMKKAEQYTDAIAASCERVLNRRLPTRDASTYGEGMRFHQSGSHLVYHRSRFNGDLEVVRILHRRMQIEDHL